LCAHPNLVIRAEEPPPNFNNLWDIPDDRRTPDLRHVLSEQNVSTVPGIASTRTEGVDVDEPGDERTAGSSRAIGMAAKTVRDDSPPCAKVALKDFVLDPRLGVARLELLQAASPATGQLGMLIPKKPRSKGFCAGQTTRA